MDDHTTRFKRIWWTEPRLQVGSPSNLLYCFTKYEIITLWKQLILIAHAVLIANAQKKLTVAAHAGKKKFKTKSVWTTRQKLGKPLSLTCRFEPVL